MHNYKYWFDNLTLLRKTARENNVRAKEIQKLKYDRHTKPHKLEMGDKVLMKVHGIKEHDDIKLRQRFKGVYTIVPFLSPTNVILCDGYGKQLPRSVYIHILIKYKDI